MNRSDVAYLVVETFTQNEYGVMIPSTTKHKVYVDVASANQQVGEENIVTVARAICIKSLHN